MIFVDSNIPMYLVGAAHPNKDAAIRLLDQLIARGERLVTDAEVLQEILHRYHAIKRPDAMQPAFDAVLGVVDEVFAIERADVERHRLRPDRGDRESLAAGRRRVGGGTLLIGTARTAGLGAAEQLDAAEAHGDLVGFLLGKDAGLGELLQAVELEVGFLLVAEELDPGVEVPAKHEMQGALDADAGEDSSGENRRGDPGGRLHRRHQVVQREQHEQGKREAKDRAEGKLASLLGERDGRGEQRRKRIGAAATRGFGQGIGNTVVLYMPTSSYKLRERRCIGRAGGPEFLTRCGSNAYDFERSRQCPRLRTIGTRLERIGLEFLGNESELERIGCDWKAIGRPIRLK